VIEYYQGTHIIFYVYRRDGDYKLVGRLVYDTSQLSPIKREYWSEVKTNALNLGNSFNDSNEFLKRILAVSEWKKGGGDGGDHKA
jgi:hypothetical protein